MTSPRDSYLENEVLSATPAKLQLMLIEAAMRFAERARGHWQAGQNELACGALIRAQEIVTELTSGLNRDASPGITGRLAAVYMFVFRTLVQANLEHSEKLLDDALRVLAVERETWRQVARQSQPADEEPAPAPSAPLPPHFELDSTAAGFSLEA